MAYGQENRTPPRDRSARRRRCTRCSRRARTRPSPRFRSKLFPASNRTHRPGRTRRSSPSSHFALLPKSRPRETGRIAGTPRRRRSPTLLTTQAARGSTRGCCLAIPALNCAIFFFQPTPCGISVSPPAPRGPYCRTASLVSGRSASRVAVVPSGCVSRPAWLLGFPSSRPVLDLAIATAVGRRPSSPSSPGAAPSPTEIVPCRSARAPRRRPARSIKIVRWPRVASMA